MKVFCTKTGEIEKLIMDKLTTNTLMHITDEQQAEFDNAMHCYLCNKKIADNDKQLVKLEITTI